MDELRNMLFSWQQQMVLRLKEIQTQSETRFAKIEAELSSFIPAGNQRFSEVERRVVEEENSSQASVSELRKVKEYLQQQIVERKDKEAAVYNELKKIETYLDEYQMIRKKLQ
ncbi:hypothetical protein LY90DRAFT_517511 [Neocallimastix californiae]|uniref:Uncharacterized protein n=1 Tax=Neocallimastix californiae TaxID=1754190 RepID=A0A1Y2A6D1_9FUNG|nr:hypothetical protein LY90DRAFT_517511 [Neocallimastix californiae]|eukprot:ORY17880.1 hypothetical protein LY90DRAFT_517511 [Neocallimastix californiae]